MAFNVYPAGVWSFWGPIPLSCAPTASFGKEMFTLCHCAFEVCNLFLFSIFFVFEKGFFCVIVLADFKLSL